LASLQMDGSWQSRLGFPAATVLSTGLLGRGGPSY